MTADERLRPIEATCGQCGAESRIYPSKYGGALICPNCSPAWLEPFLKARMNRLRGACGLEKI